MQNTIKFITIFLVAILLISCGNGSNVKKGSIKRYELNLITQDAKTSPTYQGALAFSQKLEQLSSGTMSVKFNDAGDITELSSIVEPVISGKFDIVILGYANLYYAIPELELIAQAYVIRDYEHFLKVLDSDYGDRMNKAFYNVGLIPSDIWYVGSRHVTSNNPLNSLSDFRGLRLRTPPLQATVNFAEAIGAIAMPTSFAGLYNSLKQGYVSSQENPLTVIEAAKIYELQKYIALTGHSISASTLFINKKVYESFSAEQEAWYNEALEYGQKVCNDLVFEQEKTLLEKFEKENGMTITRPNRSELQAAMKPLYEQLEQRFGEGSVYNLIEIK